MLSLNCRSKGHICGIFSLKSMALETSIVRELCETANYYINGGKEYSTIDPSF